MSDTPTVDTAIRDAAKLEEQLAEVRQEMERQLKLVDAEDYDAFDASCAALGPKLRVVTAADCQITNTAFAHIEDIRRLHHEIGLRLADQSAAAAKGLDRVRAGKNMLKAYTS
ncbi:MAG: hypothetical protein GVY16_04950 [Planctomycetes bacterium]|jgi:hypothetical protein|nr:hypothetical protein [Phycisphaerae bacterium]NBB95071.1 hypothetical protein [Planctomycetota bacterium]